MRARPLTRDTFASIVTSSVGRGIHVATHRPAGPARCARACCRGPRGPPRVGFILVKPGRSPSPLLASARPRSRGSLASTIVRRPSDRAEGPQEKGPRTTGGAPRQSRPCHRFSRAICRGDTGGRHGEHARVQYGRVDTSINTRCCGVRSAPVGSIRSAHRPGRGAADRARNRGGFYLPRHLARDYTLAGIHARSPITRDDGGPCPGLSSFVTARDPASRYVHHFDFFGHVVRAGGRQLVAAATAT